jgi:3-oxoacyl-[acyl-carrier protein] reductase
LDINGAIALVTGGGKGLGLAIAEHLQAKGARVVVVDLDQEALARLPECMAGYLLDVTNPDDVKRVTQTIVDQHGCIDILVNNAGVIYSEPMLNMMNPVSMMHDYERFRKYVTLNMDSVFIMTSAVVEQMVMKRRKGVVVNISSISARGNEGQTAYSAAKAGVEAMTVTWSKELGRLGIRCNAVAPGFIGTESTSAALSEAIVEHVRSKTPLRRLGVPDEVAHAVAALVENDFMNGVILDVNGGLTI